MWKHFQRSSTIAFLGMAISISLFLPVCIECRAISKSPIKSPLVTLSPEDKEITRQIEIQLNANTSTLECSTRDDIGPVLPQTRNGIISSRYRWTNFNVYPDPYYSASERTLINNAMVRLSQVLPCVRFNLFDSATGPPNGDYVHIKSKVGCYSYIGKRGGAQEMSLQSSGCMTIGTIMHEMIHALGFDHEQARPDRDDYVTVLWENIEDGRSKNFRKLSYSQVSTFNTAYNTMSIMHYGPKYFSKNGLPTIESKDGSAVGSVGELQDTDIEKLKRMYKC